MVMISLNGSTWKIKNDQLCVRPPCLLVVNMEKSTMKFKRLEATTGAKVGLSG